MAVDLGKRVAQYVALRDKIREMNKAHEEAIKPYEDALFQLNSVLLQHLTAQNVESVKTEFGTVYKSRRYSASIQDVEAFWDYVVQNQAWELVDKRANANACADHATQTGNPPPGLNFSSIYTAGVRRA